ncbi:hypothetical protein L596_027261 [Steinernema carpocapsae]|uniref:Uncharacterized protein n=1 Tax=Steinernema carpocapsae TaxID=34508 RepID=A0A4U5M3T2_STECR|nr:hypothetical protein L596_027261 [Steinernema carpocapsae]
MSVWSTSRGWMYRQASETQIVMARLISTAPLYIFFNPLSFRQFGSKTQAPISDLQIQIEPETPEEAFPALGFDPSPKPAPTTFPEEAQLEETTKKNAELDVQEAPEAEEESQEDLLRRTFIAALIYRLTKSAVFPYDVGQFYSNCLLKTLPEGRRLDIKKTKYKKFSTFLKEVNQGKDGPFVKVTQKGKGNDVISEYMWWHPEIKAFKLTDEKITDDVVDVKTEGPKIHEFYAVTEPVLHLLRSVEAVKKGDLLDAKDIRQMITHYVKTQGRKVSNGVALNEVLKALVPTGSPEQMDWNTLMQHVFNKMTKTFVIRLPDGREIVKRQKIPMITFLVS